MAGVDIGRVHSIGITNNSVLVRMKLNYDAPVKTDSVATVKFAGLMGQNYVSIDFGSPSAPKASNDSLLASAEQPDLSAMMKKIDNVATGVENLTKTLAVEWAAHGLRVNAIAPGVIRTSGTAQYPEELLESSRRTTPLKRLGTEEEVSHLIVYLASRHADFVTGQTFQIDGGRSLWGDSWQIPEDVPNHSPYPDPASRPGAKG